MKILLTNDDGINSPNLRALYFALKKAGHDVYAIAPMRQQSGMAHSVTVFGPIMTREVRDGDFVGAAVHGTPADCVKLGLGHMAPFQPDLVVSGINQGPNAGPDIYYSGTVAAASEAAQAGVPAIAFSHLSVDGPEDLEEVAAHAAKLAQNVDWRKIPAGRVINVNYPARPLKDCAGIKVCRQSTAPWPNEYERRTDPRGGTYWWFSSSLDPAAYGEESDRAFLDKGYVTITPLILDRTDHEALAALDAMPLA